MNSNISDELALQKANSMDWLDNQANAVDFIKPKLKRTVFKKAKVDLSDLSFNELAEKYAETMERLHAYRSTPNELLDCLKDEISGTVRFMVALKIRMSKVANPEQSMFLKEFDKLKKKVAIKSGDSEEVAKLKNQVKQLSEHINTLKESVNPNAHAEKMERIRLTNDRERCIHRHFKELIKPLIGIDSYMVLIRKASDAADAEIEAGKRLEAL